MNIAKLGLFLSLVTVGIGPIQGWSAETQKKSAATLQPQKAVTPLEKQTLQGSSPSVKAECPKAGQAPGSQLTGPCAEKGVDVGSQKNLGGPSGKPGTPALSGHGQVTGGQPSGTPLASPTDKMKEKMDKLKQQKEGDKGKELTADDFSREKQLRDLADPKGGAGPVKGVPNAGTSPADKGLGSTSGTDLLGSGRATVGRDDGKNETSKQDQIGRRGPGETRVGGKNEYGGKTYTSKGREKDGDGKMQEVHSARKEDAKEVTRELRRFFPDDGTTIINTYDKQGISTGATIIGGGDPEKKTDPKKTPTPDSAGGDGAPLPKGVSGKDPKKSPSEIEAERKRQVSLPTDDQSRPQEGRVYVSPETLKTMQQGKLGDKINPADGRGDGTTTSGGKATKQPWQGKGPQPGDPLGEMTGTDPTTDPSTPSKTGQ